MTAMYSTGRTVSQVLGAAAGPLLRDLKIE